MSEPRRTAYVAEFARIGRARPPALPIDVDPASPAAASAADRIAAVVYQYARRFLGSRDVLVSVDLDLATGTGTGWINVGGFRDAGTFTIAPAPTGEA